MSGSTSPVQAEVREGESLSLRVEFHAYPTPRSLFWSYNGKRLLNTTEHVITVHQRKYRYNMFTSVIFHSKYECMHMQTYDMYVCFIRYISELRLVRVLGSEGGIYQFSASHEDASVNHLFHVYVNSKLPNIYYIFYNNSTIYNLRGFFFILTSPIISFFTR